MDQQQQQQQLQQHLQKEIQEELQQQPESQQQVYNMKRQPGRFTTDQDKILAQKYTGYSANPKRPFACMICNKTFQSKYTILIHILGLHLKVPRYVCQHCGNKFVWHMLYKTHVRKCEMQFSIQRPLSLGNDYDSANGISSFQPDFTMLGPATSITPEEFHETQNDGSSSSFDNQPQFPGPIQFSDDYDGQYNGEEAIQEGNERNTFFDNEAVDGVEISNNHVNQSQESNTSTTIVLE